MEVAFPIWGLDDRSVPPRGPCKISMTSFSFALAGVYEFDSERGKLAPFLRWRACVRPAKAIPRVLEASMSWIWKRRMRDCAARDSPSASAKLDPSELASELASRGVPAASCDALAAALAPHMAARATEGREHLVDGVAMAFAFQEATHLEVLNKLREVQEVEKMMGAFSGELSKLDEVLEVLATYVRRMRGSSSAQGDRILH